MIWFSSQYGVHNSSFSLCFWTSCVPQCQTVRNICNCFNRLLCRGCHNKFTSCVAYTLQCHNSSVAKSKISSEKCLSCHSSSDRELLRTERPEESEWAAARCRDAVSGSWMKLVLKTLCPLAPPGTTLWQDSLFLSLWGKKSVFNLLPRVPLSPSQPLSPR